MRIIVLAGDNQGKRKSEESTRCGDVSDSRGADTALKRKGDEGGVPNRTTDPEDGTGT